MLKTLCNLTFLLVCGLTPFSLQAQTDNPTRIGIIGAGKIGGALGEHWARAGHEVFLSSRHPERLQSLADALGPKAQAGYPRDAAAFGEVVLISVPYGALPQVARDYAEELKGKVVLETGNPFPGRDGDMAYAARDRGAGIHSASLLPGVRLVRAFNSIPAYSVRSEAHRAGEKIGVPLASDDAEAMQVAAQLVRDAGFEPVIVGDINSSRRFDVGTNVFGRALSVSTLRETLGLD